MKGHVDLHLHSTVSDGAVDPGELARRAVRAGLTTVALTDHDSTAGCEALAGAAPELRSIPAIELTCRVTAGPLGTVHVLGYGIDPAAPALERAARTSRLAKRRQVEAILADLAAREGIVIRWEDVAGERGDEAYVGRNQIASVLVARGAVRDRRKAFRRFLAGPKVPPLEAVPAEEGVAAIHAAGGTSVLAHPTQRDLDRHLRPLLRLGLQGLEVYRPRTREHVVGRLERRARECGLLVTGGSDWHGHYPEPPLGTWRPPAAALEPFLEAVGAA